MPELPEVEVLVRHLRPALVGQRIRTVEVRRERVVRPDRPADLVEALNGCRIVDLQRRGKYLLFAMRPPRPRPSFTVLGHLGMTGRMFVAPAGEPLPKHTAVTWHLGRQRFIYEDPRYFGRFTRDLTSVAELGPEPWDTALTEEVFWRALKRSRQPVKVRLLDQSLIAGVGNIYASESLFQARITPRRPAHRLTRDEAGRLLAAIRSVLDQAIVGGSTIPLNFSGSRTDGLFYFGRAADAPDYYTERLQVYDRAGEPCPCCGTPIRRAVQAARSTYWCSRCQP